MKLRKSFLFLRPSDYCSLLVSLSLFGLSLWISDELSLSSLGWRRGGKERQGELMPKERKRKRGEREQREPQSKSTDEFRRVKRAKASKKKSPHTSRFSLSSFFFFPSDRERLPALKGKRARVYSPSPSRRLLSVNDAGARSVRERESRSKKKKLKQTIDRTTTKMANARGSWSLGYFLVRLFFSLLAAFCCRRL